jgi:uridine kinase
MNIKVKYLFIFGLLAKICAIVLSQPDLVSQWYLPFLANSVESFSLDPWESWLTQNKDPLAFPYGYAMWLILLPAALISHILISGSWLAYAATLLIFDLGLFKLLNRLWPERKLAITAVYWCSPVIFIATYLLGYNDIIPITILILCVSLIKRNKWVWGALALAIALSVKLSMILAVPFIIVYFLNKHDSRKKIRELIYYAATIFLTLAIPFMLSPELSSMIFSNPEVLKVYSLNISLTEGLTIYVVPLTYLVLLYFFWRIRRINHELLLAFIGINFLVIVLLTPASPGWFIWCLPLLAQYQARKEARAIFWTSGFSILYILLVLINGQHLDLSELGQINSPWLHSIIHTAMVSVGVILIINLYDELINKNIFFKFSKEPLVIGIAGDSGAGKDTLVNHIKDIFGHSSISHISGDDYHLWERKKPMWQVITHLNPMANNLEKYAKDLIDLSSGRSVISSHYNHESGKFDKPQKIQGKNIIIASGLHALYLPILRESYDLKIFLDIDEQLRRFFKIQRDVHERGHAIEKVKTSLDERLNDFSKFIKPQMQTADLILKLQPVKHLALDDTSCPFKKLKLSITSKSEFNELSIARTLIGICGLHVEIETEPDHNQIHLMIEGDCTHEDIEMAAKILGPKLYEFLDDAPQWQNGIAGIMQLVVFCHINQVLSKRRIL